MKITREWLKKKYACPEAIKWFCSQKSRDSNDIIRHSIKTKKHLDKANWLMVLTMTYKQYVGLAVYGAEQVLDVYENKYPNDKTPRNAIELAKKCIKNPSDKNKADACSAGDEVHEIFCPINYIEAGYAAIAARDAARAAAESEALYACDTSASMAVDDGTKLLLKILKHGLRLIKK